MSRSIDLVNIVTRLAAVLVWPIVVSVFLWHFRDVIQRLLIALTGLTESANKIKIWQIEIDRDIDHELDKTAKLATESSLNEQSVPAGEVDAARRVGLLLARVPASSAKNELIDSVKQKMLRLAQEYETTRANMRPGDERTRALNAVLARMRALAIPAKTFLKEFSESRDSPGQRLAAVAILQMAPDLEYLDWLAARMSKEQPFIFYHASAALLAMVRAFGSANAERLDDALNFALHIIKAHPKPDRNTVITLESALSELRAF